MLLKLYIYGYLNRVQSSRRLEREADRNVELMWLVGRLVPDHKTIADFRRDNGAAIQGIWSRLVLLCRQNGPSSRRGRRHQGVPVTFSPKVAVGGMTENSHFWHVQISKSLNLQNWQPFGLSRCRYAPTDGAVRWRSA